jgi:hypothetical protein
MIRTPICRTRSKLSSQSHVVEWGSATSPALVATVARAGGLRALGCHYRGPERNSRVHSGYPPGN